VIVTTRLFDQKNNIGIANIGKSTGTIYMCVKLRKSFFFLQKLRK